MRKKLLQNTLFAAMAAWALYLAHTQTGSDQAMSQEVAMWHVNVAQR
jgi:hypothetical protein